MRMPIYLIALGFCFVTPISFAQSLPDFSKLAQENGPAVVNISTTQKKASRSNRLPPRLEIPDIPEDSPLYDFFRHFFGDGIEIPQDVEPLASLGSGFIISNDGYVITNHHVVKDADEIIVRLSDRREFNAKVIGSDERSDLAVLKIKADSLPTVRLGHSTDLKVGEWVLAIGSPFGFEHSVTAGIVSAKGRSLPNERYVPFIQTDVAINPGNSGGPLFNLNGEVVGVNSQIYSRTGGFMGLSFAIPVEVVMNVYQQLSDKGSVSRGWLGVHVQDVTRELAESFGMERPRGALVAQVLPNSPAAKAGFQPGDIVVEFNGQPIELSSELPPLVGNVKVGEKFPVKIIREGKPIEINVEIEELPEEEELKLASGAGAEGMADSRLGVVVKDPTEKQRQRGEPVDHGVLVERVMEGPARKAGIRAGDILLRINNEKIKDTKHFKDLVSSLPAGKSIPILVQRDGNPLFMAIKLSKK